MNLKNRDIPKHTPKIWHWLNLAYTVTLNHTYNTCQCSAVECDLTGILHIQCAMLNYQRHGLLYIRSSSSTRMIIIHLLCRWNVNKYSCTAIFGNVLFNIQSSIVYMIAFQTRKLSTELYVPVYSILISTTDPQTFHDHMQKITTDWKDKESKCVDYFM